MQDIIFDSRDQLPALLNGLGLLGLGVEVGVQRGVNASNIRSKWRGEKLYLVDPWVPYFGTLVNGIQHEQYYADCLSFMSAFPPESVGIMRMTSLDAAAQMYEILGGRKLDFAYLDAAHEYEKVIQDIDLWWPHVKSGGVLAGHDYVPDGWHRDGDPVTAYATAAEAGNHCGPFEVIKAVQDSFGPAGHTPLKIHVTRPDTDMGWRSWLVVKP